MSYVVSVVVVVVVAGHCHALAMLLSIENDVQVAVAVVDALVWRSARALSLAGPSSSSSSLCPARVCLSVSLSAPPVALSV